jgi:hypothetical protein
MKPLLLLLLSLAILPAPVFAQVGTPQSVAIRYSKDERAVLAAHEARRLSLLANDLPALEKLLADKLVYVHSSAKVDSKAEFLSALRSGASRYERQDLRNTFLHFGPKLSVIGGETTIQVKTPERQLIRWQTTRLPAPEPPK